MAVHLIHDLYDDKTLHIIAGGQEFFYFDIFTSYKDGNIDEPADLSSVNEIEWLFAPYSVTKEKGHAKLIKKLTTGQVSIMKNKDGALSNQIQVIISGADTKNLFGAFLYQLFITDGAGITFVPFEGVININKKISIG